MSKKWFSGPPPSCGWWQASWGDNPKILRWWDGERWSDPARMTFDAVEAAERASTFSDFSAHIRWKHRPASWPARSRT